MKLKQLLVNESGNTLDAVLKQLPMMAKNGASKEDMLISIMDASESFDMNDKITWKLIIQYKQYLPREVVDMAEFLKALDDEKKWSDSPA